MRHYLFLIGLFWVVSSSLNAHAQGQAESADQFLQKQNEREAVEQKSELSEIEASVAQAKAELADEDILAKKIALAKQMHQIRPTREQVDSAILRAAQNLPPAQQSSFITSMTSILNYNAIERISIDAMVETYSLKELEAMVAYYSLPEAISASKKTRFWAGKVQPEIVRMIDKAMIRVRTGQ